MQSSKDKLAAIWTAGEEFLAERQARGQTTPTDIAVAMLLPFGREVLRGLNDDDITRVAAAAAAYVASLLPDGYPSLILDPEAGAWWVRVVDDDDVPMLHVYGEAFGPVDADDFIAAILSDGASVAVASLPEPGAVRGDDGDGEVDPGGAAAHVGPRPEGDRGSDGLVADRVPAGSAHHA